MASLLEELADAGKNPPPLPGRIAYDKKENGDVYGAYVKESYRINGRLRHVQQHLGRVISKEHGVFRSQKLGCFT
ncbi:MAG: hypothetical protein LBW85_06245, partial [Deltaproteobacteria bacterium]|nr:hypothetical protein [Deltaproteobacteria bacterium]